LCKKGKRTGGRGNGEGGNCDDDEENNDDLMMRCFYAIETACCAIVGKTWEIFLFVYINI
jgi:hypothetical protein